MLSRKAAPALSLNRAREICREIAASKGVAFFGLQKHPEPHAWTVIFAHDRPVTRHFTAPDGDETTFRRSLLATVFDEH